MCKILPPNQLYFPVLPARINKKLLFTLCSACGENKSRECNHSDDERCLDGTWVTLEVQQAVKQGYKINNSFHYTSKLQTYTTTLSRREPPLAPYTIVIS